MGRSLVKVSRKKSDDRKDGRVKRRGLSRRRKQRGGTVTPALENELNKITALLADSGKTSDVIGTESADAQAAAVSIRISLPSINSDDDAPMDTISKINKNIQQVVTFLNSKPAPATATDTEPAIVAYNALLGIEPKVQNTSLYKGLQKIYTNLKEDGTVDKTALGAALGAASLPAATSALSAAGKAAAGVDPTTLPGLTHIAVFVPIETNTTTNTYAVKSGDPSPYAYYVSDTSAAGGTGAGLVNIDATGATKTVVKCDDVKTWTTHP